MTRRYRFSTVPVIEKSLWDKTMGITSIHSTMERAIIAAYLNTETGSKVIAHRLVECVVEEENCHCHPFVYERTERSTINDLLSAFRQFRGN